MVYVTRRNAPYASIQVSVFFLFSEMRLNETPNASGFGHFYFAKLRKCSFSAILWPIGLGKKKKKGKNYREENYHPHSPPCSDTPSPPWDPAPAQPLWLWNLFPPPHPKDNINPHDSPIPGSPQQPWGTAWTSRCSGALSLLVPGPHPRAGTATQPPVPHLPEHPHSAPGPRGAL